jgi:hypothetical protein
MDFKKKRGPKSPLLGNNYCSGFDRQADLTSYNIYELGAKEYPVADWGYAAKLGSICNLNIFAGCNCGSKFRNSTKA